MHVENLNAARGRCDDGDVCWKPSAITRRQFRDRFDMKLREDRQAAGIVGWRIFKAHFEMFLGEPRSKCFLPIRVAFLKADDIRISSYDRVHCRGGRSLIELDVIRK